MTKDDAIRIIAKRLESKYQTGLTWAQFTAAVGGLEPAEKASLLAAAKAGNDGAIGRIVLQQISEWTRAQALTEATTMLADDSLSLAELEQIL